MYDTQSKSGLLTLVTFVILCPISPLIVFPLQALHFYRQAASGGHSQAQYRCAKLLLNSRGQQSTQQDLDTAISLLQQAASAGLREVRSEGVCVVMYV